MTLIEILVGFVRVIPATFWGIVIGSLFTISGVILSNRASEKRLRLQYLYERELKNTDRNLAMKKDVYLSVCDTACAGLAAIGKLPNLDMAQESILEEYSGKAAAISKVHIIAREDTIRAVIDVVNGMSSSIIKLTAKRMPLILLQKQLIQLNAQILEFGKECDRWLEEMKQYNLSGIIDQRRFNVMEENFKFEQQRIQECREKITDTIPNFRAEQLDFAKECTSELCKIIDAIIPAVMAMRGELGIATQREEFPRIFSEALGGQKIMLDKFFEGIEKSYKLNSSDNKI